jgi:hypothetical protein
MNLTDREKELLKGMIDRGEPLPPKYRLSLFADAPDVELIWQGKTSEVANVVLPFQSIEQVDEPRTEVGATVGGGMGLFVDKASGRQAGGWANKLIWGDNKLVLASLKNGPLRKEIEDAGGLKLVYIDPPFDVGADFAFNVEVGDGETLTKEPTVIEELAYRDTWGRGADSYIAMLYERLHLIHALLSPTGSIYVHCDWRVNSYIRLVLDELFGSRGFGNQIIWKRQSAHSGASRFGMVHDVIYFFHKSENYVWNTVLGKFSPDYVEQFFDQVDEKSGKRYARGDLTGSGLRFGETGRPWKGIDPSKKGRHWAYMHADLDRFEHEGRIHWPKDTSGMPRLKRFEDDLEGAEARARGARSSRTRVG